MDLNLFERDCEQACYRFLEEKKRLIREGNFCELDIDDPLILAYTDYRYRPSNNFEAQRAMLIVKSWKARASSELREYWETYKAEKKEERRRYLDREEQRRREEERQREKEAEERRREKEERRRKEEEEERRREEQDKKNKAELDRIQEEWNARRSANQSPVLQQSADTIFCSACGSANAKSAKFCQKCGVQLQMKCPSCGGLTRVGSKFCSRCGAPINHEK